MTDKERRDEVCRLWKEQGPKVWEAETGTLTFYLLLSEKYPELVPDGGKDVDPYQLLRAQISECTDA